MSVKEFIYVLVQPFCYATLFISIRLLLRNRFGKWFNVILFSYLTILEGVESLIVLRFGAYMTGDLIMICLNSSWTEMVAFINDMSLVNVVGGVVVFTAIFSTGIKVMMQSIEVPQYNAFIFILPFIFFNCVYLSPRLLPRQMLFSRIIVDTVFELSANNVICRACKEPQFKGDVYIDKCCEEYSPLGVFIIGESTTRNNMSLYGYRRETTPKMDVLKGELLIFDNMLACWSNTQGVLHHLLMDSTIDSSAPPNYSLCSLLTMAGYKCFLASNQSRWGAYDSLTSLLFVDCVERIYMKEAFPARHVYDPEMVQYVNQFAKSSPNTPCMVFLHLQGSHFPPKSAFPTQAAKFPNEFDDEYVHGYQSTKKYTYNQYDNSILQTDMLVGSVIDELKKCDRPTFMIFVSDHGETPRSDSMRCMVDTDLWEIPMVIWISDKYAALCPSLVSKLNLARPLKLQNDQLFYGFCNLAGVRGSWDVKDKDFLSGGFVERTVRYIGNGQIPYRRDLKR
jgi:heptose-I-phosphate ethanolaminephosphotransferase